jgi:hypothetical protein
MDMACVQEQYLENICHKKGKPINSKQKEHREASKEGKKKWKVGEDKKMEATTHQCKDPNNHYNHCNINGQIEEKCWKPHLEMNPKNHKKDSKKKNLLATNSSNQIKRNSDVYENNLCILVKKEVNLSSLHQWEEKEMNKHFHIKIQVKKTKINVMFNSGSQVNLIAIDLVNKHGLEVRNHPKPYPLGVNKDAKIKVMK